jgi:hypothetical protein
MEKTMTGMHLPYIAKVATAVASLMLSIAATTSSADNADQIAVTREGARGINQYSAPARNRAFTNEARSSTECVGGYRWRTQEINSNLTDAQQSVPLPC